MPGINAYYLSILRVSKTRAGSSSEVMRALPHAAAAAVHESAYVNAKYRRAPRTLDH
jgi:hypothetical protein